MQSVTSIVPQVLCFTSSQSLSKMEPLALSLSHGNQFSAIDGPPHSKRGRDKGVAEADICPDNPIRLPATNRLGSGMVDFWIEIRTEKIEYCCATASIVDKRVDIKVSNVTKAIR